MNRCPVTKKYCYDAVLDAEYAADRVALVKWAKGRDAEMAVYWCEHCQSSHVGTRQERPVHAWKLPLHEYKHLPSPRPRHVQHVATGNVLIYKEKTHANARPNYIPRPRRNRQRRGAFPPARGARSA